MEYLNGWHWSANKLRDGSDLPVKGDVLVYEGKIVPCRSGYHCSERALDALRYAPGPFVAMVRLSGDLQSHGNPIDKWVGRSREYTSDYVDATSVLQVFARRCALDVVDMWDCSQVAREWLETGDPRLRDAARAAAWAVRDAAEAARDAAEAAAEAAVRDAAWAVRAAAWAVRDAAWAAGAAARNAASATAWATAMEAAGAASATAWATAMEAAGAAMEAADAAAWAAAREAADAAACATAREAAWAAAREAADAAALNRYNEWLEEMLQQKK